MTDEMTYETMPDEVTDALKRLGMDDQQAYECGILGQKVKAFVLEQAAPGDKVSPAQLYVAGVACGMTAEWFKGVAMEVAKDTGDITDG